MLVRNFPDGMQPMVDEAAPLAVDRRAHAAAAVMADHHDVLDLEHVDRELQHREIIGVLRRGEVRDIAVDEQLAGIEIDDLVGGHAAVGAADPQILGRLLAFEPTEETGVGRHHALCPGAVIGLEMIEHGLPIAPAVRRHKTSSAPGRSRKPGRSRISIGFSTRGPAGSAKRSDPGKLDEKVERRSQRRLRHKPALASLPKRCNMEDIARRGFP